MPVRRSHLDLLEAIASGETRGARLLAAWADTTADAGLAEALRAAAAHDRAQAAAFRERLQALGRTARVFEDPTFADRLARAAGDGDDLERFRILLGHGTGRDPLAGLDRLFADRDIDPDSGALLGRYIAETRACDRMLQAHRSRLLAGQRAPAAGDARAHPVAAGTPMQETTATRPAAAPPGTTGPPDPVDARMARLRRFLDPGGGGS